MLFPFVKTLANKHKLGKYENIDELLIEVEELLNTEAEDKEKKFFQQ